MTSAFNVRIDAVYPPKTGKKTGTIKATTATGETGYFDVWPDKQPEFDAVKGQQVTIHADPREWNGKTFWTAKSVTGGAPAQAAPAPSASPFTPAQQPAATGDHAEDIFVTGIVGRAMGSGQFGVTDIGALTKAAVQAWQGRHGQPAAPSAADFPADRPVGGMSDQPAAGGDVPPPWERTE